MVKNTLLEETHGNLLRVKVLDVVVMFTSSGSRVENITHKYIILNFDFFSTRSINEFKNNNFVSLMSMIIQKKLLF